MLFVRKPRLDSQSVVVHRFPIGSSIPVPASASESRPLDTEQQHTHTQRPVSCSPLSARRYLLTCLPTPAELLAGKLASWSAGEIEIESKRETKANPLAHQFSIPSHSVCSRTADTNGSACQANCWRAPTTLRPRSLTVAHRRALTLIPALATGPPGPDIWCVWLCSNFKQMPARRGSWREIVCAKKPPQCAATGRETSWLGLKWQCNVATTVFREASRP